MQVSCPGCKRVYKIDETALPETGKKMRCPKCTKVFTVTQKGIGASLPETESPRTSSTVLPKKPTLPKSTAKATPPRPPASKGLPLPTRTGETDFSDLRISFSPKPPPKPPAAPSPKPKPKRALTGEFDLDAHLKEPSLSPLPSLGPPDADGFDLSGFDDPIFSSAPPDAAAPPSGRDMVELPSMPPNTPAVELDETSQSSRSLPAALGLPETSEEIEMPRISFHEPPSLTTIPPEEAEDDFGAIDFGPSVERSADVTLDDDAEFDFRGSEPEEATPLGDVGAFDQNSFGEIELDDEDISAAPAQSPPLAPPQRAPSPPTQSMPPFEEPEPPPTDKFPSLPPEAVDFDSPISTQPPLGIDLESEEAPFAGMPSPAELLKLADEPPPHPKTAPNITQPSAALKQPIPRAGVGAADYGEVDLPRAETSGVLDLDAEEFDAFPVRRTSAGAALDGLDLAADPMSLRSDEGPSEEEAEDGAAAPEDTRKRAAFEGRRRFERQSRRTKLLLLGLLAVTLAAGGALSFTSLGPFGANILFRLLPKPVNSQAVDAAVQSARKKIEKDTLPAYREAVGEVEEIYKEYPSSEDLQFYLIYLYYMTELRFGEDKALDAKATKALGVAGFTESSSGNASLAQAAQYLRFSRPFPQNPALVNALKQSADGLVLLTEAALAKGDTAQALQTVKTLEAKESSPRADYLAGRVLMAQGDKAHIAEAAARLMKLRKSAPDHLDAPLLAAEALLSQKGYDAAVVREMIQGVESKFATRKDVLDVQKAEAHAVLARLLVNERNYSKAEKEVALAEKLDPENVSMLLAKGRIALVRKDYSTAATTFAKAAANAPKNVFAALGKIETDIRTGELAETKKALEALMPVHKDVALAHYLMGEIHIALKDNEAGETELKKAIALDDTLLEAYVGLSTYYLSEGRNDDAMKILDKASETVPGSPLIKKTLAAGHAARGDWASAIVELDNALKLDPDDVDAHFQMAVMYRKMDSLDDAKRALEEVEKRNSAYPGLALEQGLLMERRGDTASALSAYKKALSLSPTDVGLMLRVGVASFLAGDLEGAQTQLKNVLEKEPASPEANFYYGETLRRSKRTAESLAYLQKATELVKDNPLYHLRYGMALEATRDVERAVAELQKALALDPKTAEAYVVIGKIKLRLGAVRDAAQSLEKGLSMNPDIKDGYLAAAEAYEQLSQMSQARKYYLKAAEEQPDNPEVHYRLGLAELQTNGKAASLDGFTKAVALTAKSDPKPDWYYEALYRRGVGERAKGMRAQAIATFQQYLKEAPEKAIDRSEVVANLDEMGQ